MMKNVVALLVVILVGLQLGLTHAGLTVSSTSQPSILQPGPGRNAPYDKSQWQKYLTSILPSLSGEVMLKIAPKLGITTILGKPLGQQKASQLQPRLSGPDIPVASDPKGYEQEPSVAVNPKNDKQILMISEDSSPFGCGVYASLYGGLVWASEGSPPPSVSGDWCSDPIVRWSPDGTVAYFAYLSLRPGSPPPTSDVVVTRDTCPPFGCWDWRVVMFPGSSGYDLWDRPWLDVHEVDPSQAQASVVYVTATYFSADSYYGNLIAFDSSIDYGSTWNAWQGGGSNALILSSVPPTVPLVQMGRAIGAIGSNMLVCWYNSEADGQWVGKFSIRCLYSSNYGYIGSWFPEEVIAAPNVKYELPYYLCPSTPPPGLFGFYHRWWAGMSPVLAISPDGRAHIVFARDPIDPATHYSSAECGNVVYTQSKLPPYTTWSPLATIGSSGSSAQGYPTIVTQVRPALPPTSKGYRLYVFYEDHRNSPTSSMTNTCATQTMEEQRGVPRRGSPTSHR
jgi:hypothetical protein